VASRLPPKQREEGSDDDDDDDDDDARLMAGTQALKRGGTLSRLKSVRNIDMYLGFKNSHRSPKRLKDIVPDDVNVELSSSASSDAEESDVEMSPSKQGKQTGGKVRGKKTKSKKKPDGWIWLESMTQGKNLSDAKMAEYKKEMKWN
jgi:hypothetical protein